MVGWYCRSMSAIGILFQLCSFLNTDHIFSFSLITFVISVVLLHYLYEQCIFLKALQYVLFLALNTILTP